MKLQRGPSSVSTFQKGHVPSSGVAGDAIVGGCRPVADSERGDQTARGSDGSMAASCGGGETSRVKSGFMDSSLR